MAGICAGNLVLASAGLLKGVYAPPTLIRLSTPLQGESRRNGTLPGTACQFERADLVEDGKRITAQHWAHEKFAAAVARHLGLPS